MKPEAITEGRIIPSNTDRYLAPPCVVCGDKPCRRGSGFCSDVCALIWAEEQVRDKHFCYWQPVVQGQIDGWATGSGYICYPLDEIRSSPSHPFQHGDCAEAHRRRRKAVKKRIYDLKVRYGAGILGAILAGLTEGGDAAIDGKTVPGFMLVDDNPNATSEA